MSGVKIGIIGGTGGMGRWLNRFFSCKGHTVLISGRKTELKYADLVEESDVVILSVPLDAALSVSAEIGPQMSREKLLMDVCSLKEKILEAMMKATSAQVIGCHPLFGPLTDSIRNQNLILCPGRGDKWIDWLEKEFKSGGGVVTRMDAVTHDRNMAFVQGLTHFITICMGRTLQKLHIDPGEALSCSTPIFRMKLSLVGRLFAQDLDLYRSLIGKNRHTAEVMDAFLSAMEEGKSNLLSGDSRAALDYLEQIRAFIGPFAEDALKESTRFLNSMYHQD